MKVKNDENLTLENLGYFVEQKISKILVDPDYGMELREDFKKKLEKQLKKGSRRIFWILMMMHS